MNSPPPHNSELHDPVLTLHGVGRSFDGVPALAPLDLTVHRGEFLSILGPSGCGKSTLLRLIAGLDRPTSGSIERRSSGRIAYVFQDAHLLPWRNVLRNVELPLELLGLSASQRRQCAGQALEQVGLTDALRRYPAQLSGGMKMRVSLARALVTEPDLLLLDEPFAALDEITRQQLDDQLHQLWARRAMTVLFVTHSIIEAAFLAQRVIVFSPRPGTVRLDRTLELPSERRPGLRSDAAFIGEMKRLYDALAGVEAGGI